MPLIDLSLVLYEGMPHHPLHPRSPVLLAGTLQHSTTRRWMGEHPEHGAVSFTNEQIVLSGHTGTHIDAPLHSDPSGVDAGGVDLAACVGPATVLDVRRWSGAHTAIPADALVEALGQRTLAPIVLLHTGRADQLDIDAAVYYGSSVGIDDGAAWWLRAQGARCVGIDAPSVDTPRAQGAPAHMRFLRERPAIVVIENLRGLDEIPPDVSFFAAAPLPLVGSSGSPVRAFAVVDAAEGP